MEKKYHFEYTDGCTCTGMTVNGVDFMDITDVSELARLAVMLLRREKDRVTLEEIIRDLVESQGECTFEWHCDQCGDDVYVTRLDVVEDVPDGKESKGE